MTKINELFEDLEDENFEDISEEEYEKRMAELSECKSIEDVLMHLAKYGTLTIIKDQDNDDFDQGPGPGDTIH